MKRLAAGLRRMQDGPVAKAILPHILRLAEQEGILRAAEAHSPFRKADLFPLLVRVLRRDTQVKSFKRLA